MGELRARDPGGDDRVHRDRDRLEPRRGGARPGAQRSRASIRLVAIAVFAIYFTLPLVALSALPVYKDATASTSTKLGLPPEQGGFENDPVLGLVENLGLHGVAARRAARSTSASSPRRSSSSPTNAGVIGASRITYSMASYRQLPGGLPAPAPAVQDAVARRSIVFAGVFSILVHAARERRLHRPHVRVRGDALVHDRARLGDPLRRKPPRSRSRTACRPNLRVRGVDWPLFAVLGGARDRGGLARRRRPGRRRRATPGSAGSRSGSSIYAVYRRRIGMRRCARRRARRSLLGPALALEYRHDPRADRRRASRREEAIDVACAARRRAAGATIVALRVIVVPLDLPLDARSAGGGGARRTAARRRPAIGELVRRARDRAPRARAQRRSGDRRGGGRAARPRSSSSGAAQDPRGRQRADLRHDGRLRAQARPVPRDGRRVA